MWFQFSLYIVFLQRLHVMTYMTLYDLHVRCFVILKVPEVDVIGTASPVSAEGQVRQRLSEQV